MSLEGVYEILLQGLAGSLSPTALHYIGAAEAHAELKRRTGKDFGRDVEAWRAFVRTMGERGGKSSTPLNEANAVKNG